MPTATKTLGLAHVQARLKDLPQHMVSEHVPIDQDVAIELLTANAHNRRLNPNKVQQYVEQMERGVWRQTGDPIRMSKTGKLIDGQHKLTAIAQADTEYEYVVIWGLDDEAQDFIDVGSKRSLAQSLALKREANSNQLSGAVRMIWQVDHAQDGSTPGRWLTEPTYAEYHDYIESYPEIRTSVQIAMKVARSLKVPASPIAAAHYFASTVAPDDADDFFTDLGDLGAVVPDDSPIIALRKTAISWASRGSVSRIEQGSLYDVCVRGFDAYRDGKAVKTPFRLTKRPRAWRMPS